MSDHITLHMQSLVSAASTLFLSQIQYSFRRCAIAPPYHITVKTQKDRKHQCQCWERAEVLQISGNCDGTKLIFDQCVKNIAMLT